MSAAPVISTDKSLLNVELIYAVLSNSYWAKDRSLEAIQKSIEHSVCFGMYLEGQQIGFARLLTDFVVFGYLMDVFIVEKHQGKGYGQLLMRKMMEHPEHQSIGRWFLGTQTAHDLYRKMGFESLAHPEIWMELKS